MNLVHLPQATDNYQDSMRYIALMANKTKRRKAKNSNQNIFALSQLDQYISRLENLVAV